MLFCFKNVWKLGYRSRQYYESKVLHDTEVTLFSTFRHSPKTDYFDQNCKRKSLHHSSRLFWHLQSRNWSTVQFPINVWISWKIVILVNFEANWSNFRYLKNFLRADFAGKNWPIYFYSKNVKRSVMNRAKTFFDSWCLNNRFLRNSGPLKIRLLQCYVVF